MKIILKKKKQIVFKQNKTKAFRQWQLTLQWIHRCHTYYIYYIWDYYFNQKHTYLSSYHLLYRQVSWDYYYCWYDTTSLNHNLSSENRLGDSMIIDSKNCATTINYIHNSTYNWRWWRKKKVSRSWTVLKVHTTCLIVYKLHPKCMVRRLLFPIQQPYFVIKIRTL